MSVNLTNDFVEQLKVKYTSAFSRKIAKEKEVYKLREKEFMLNERLSKAKEELEFLTENISEVQHRISAARHKVSIIKICKFSEKAKIDCQIKNLNQHKEGFNHLFLTAKTSAENQAKELQNKAKAKQLKHAEAKVKNEQLLQEATMVEAEYISIVRESNVLKKRNAAVMLKLRKKLIETEDIRRKLMKKKTGETESCKEN